MYNDVLTLISQTSYTDQYGDQVITETRRDVWCMFSSVGMSEFYQAHASGFKPEIKLTLSDYLDYNNEKFCEYNGERYTILRTYRKNNELEITLYKDVIS